MFVTILPHESPAGAGNDGTPSIDTCQPPGPDAARGTAEETAGETIGGTGLRYQRERGWAVFLERIGADGVRRSLPMCPACRATPHPPATCPHRACHGLYAGTTDPAEWEVLVASRPDADVLCVRTGRPSGLLVVDLDAKHGGPELHDRWPEATGYPWTFPDTLRQRTRSGGFHLLYRLPPGPEGDGIRSRNAVTAPGVDVKCEGGLIVVPPSPGYEWAPGPGELAEASSEVLEWARSARVHRGRGGRRRVGPTTARVAGDRLRGTDAGRTLVGRLGGGCPAGGRDEFANAVAFLLRKMGLDLDEARAVMREQWYLMEHPEGDEFRWEWCEYKLRKVWRDVEPDPGVAAGMRWATRADRGDRGDLGGVTRIGNVTLSPRRTEATGGTDR